MSGWRQGGRGWCGVVALLLTVGCRSLPADAVQEYIASGDRYARLGRDSAAVIEYRNAARLSPASTDAWERLAGALARLGRSEEAMRARDAAERTVDNRVLPDDEAALRDLAVAHPRHVGVRLALAERLMARGATREAEQELRAALAVDAGRELPNRALAALLVDSGRSAEAGLYLRRAAAAQPQRYRSAIALVDYLFQQRQWQEAGRVLDAATADASLVDAVAIRRIALLDATGDAAEARRQVRALLETRPAAETWALRATFAWHDGDREEAALAARQALTLDPQQAAARGILDAIRWRTVHPAADAVSGESPRTRR